MMDDNNIIYLRCTVFTAVCFLYIIVHVFIWVIRVESTVICARLDPMFLSFLSAQKSLFMKADLSHPQKKHEIK